VLNNQSAAKWLVPNLRDGGQTNEKTSPERLACCVDNDDYLSNFLEGLVKLDRFKESVWKHIF
jgi:hypothetical protein